MWQPAFVLSRPFRKEREMDGVRKIRGIPGYLAAFGAPAWATLAARWRHDAMELHLEEKRLRQVDLVLPPQPLETGLGRLLRGEQRERVVEVLRQEERVVAL